MHKVGPKGTVVIERNIREELGIEPGSEVLQRVDTHGSVVLTFLPPRRVGAAYGVLAHLVTDEVRERIRTDEGLEEVIRESAAAHFGEKYSGKATLPE